MCLFCFCLLHFVQVTNLQYVLFVYFDIFPRIAHFVCLEISWNCGAVCILKENLEHRPNQYTYEAK